MEYFRHKSVDCIILLADQNTIDDVNAYDNWLIWSAINKVFISLDAKPSFRHRLRYPLIAYNETNQVSTVHIG